MTIIESDHTVMETFRSAGRSSLFSLNQEQAIDYAKGRACFRSGEIRVLDSSGAVAYIIPFDDQGRKL
jgi:hypothetical protein